MKETTSKFETIRYSLSSFISRFDWIILIVIIVACLILSSFAKDVFKKEKAERQDRPIKLDPWYLPRQEVMAKEIEVQYLLPGEWGYAEETLEPGTKALGLTNLVMGHRVGAYVKIVHVRSDGFISDGYPKVLLQRKGLMQTRYPSSRSKKIFQK